MKPLPKKYRYLYLTPEEKIYINKYGIDAQDNFIELRKQGYTIEEVNKIISKRVKECSKIYKEQFEKNKQQEYEKLLKECPFI